MTPDRWRKLKIVFFSALECDTPEERRLVVKALCANDHELEREVLSLLDHSEKSFLKEI